MVSGKSDNCRLRTKQFRLYKKCKSKRGLSFQVKKKIFVVRSRGGSRVSSRGGADFQKNFKKFANLFSQVDQFDFLRSTNLPNHFKGHILTIFCAQQANFWKKNMSKKFLGTFC